MRFDPEDYPGARPDGPALVWDGRVWEVELDPDVGTICAPVDGAASAAPILDAGHEIRWSVAYGANADPDRLLDKGLDRTGALLLPAVATGYRRVWEARRSSTGAVPVTVVPAPGRILRTWVLGVAAGDTGVLDSSESRGSNYVLGRLGEVAVAARWRLADAVAYGPGPATRALLDGGGPASHDDLDQRGAADLLDGGAGAVTVGGLPRPVEGRWPQTPLEDIPLAVYGTLLPGESHWSRIAGLVVDAGPVRLPGVLYDTGRGWPALRSGDPGATAPVRGRLLAPRSGSAAHELFRRTDRIERAPELFRRVAVPAQRPDGGTTMAAVYAWAGGRPPGRVVPDGRWPGTAGDGRRRRG